jgi:hypothetical protein
VVGSSGPASATALCPLNALADMQRGLEALEQQLARLQVGSRRGRRPLESNKSL